MSDVSVYDRRYEGDYRENLTGYEIARWNALHHFITRVVRPGPVEDLLDYGAGSGLHVNLWERVFPETRLSFCDISSVAKEKFSGKFPHHADRYSLVGGDTEMLRTAGYDVVVSVEVMEHVGDLEFYLDDIARLLKPGGYFIWTTPCANAFSIEHLFSLITGRIQKTTEGYRRWAWEDRTHLRRLKSGEVDGLLRRRGYVDVTFRFRSHLFSFLCTYLPFSGAQSMRDRVMTLDYTLFRRLPNGASMIGAARKA
jgi:SAM-dependent methyltransferase